MRKKKTIYCPAVICLRGAVGGGADLVGNADTTLAGKTSGEGRVKSGNATGGALEAIASLLAVSGGLGLAVEVADSVAARGGDNSALLDVVEARCHVLRHLAASDGLGDGDGHHNAQESHQSKLHDCRASHNAI